MITIAVANQKGGVGKTTLSFNLAQILSKKKGMKVLAVDNDPQGNLTSSFLDENTPLQADILEAYEKETLATQRISGSLSLVGSNIKLARVAEGDFDIIFRLKEALGKMNGDFDYTIIDCLPSFGYLHMAALNAADYVLIPVKPAPYALAGMSDLFNTIEKVKKRGLNENLNVLGIVINQVDGRKPVMEREMEEVLRENYGDLVFTTKIRKRVKVEESPAFQQPITEYEPNGDSAKEFKKLAGELLKRIEKADTLGLAGDAR